MHTSLSEEPSMRVAFPLLTAFTLAVSTPAAAQSASTPVNAAVDPAADALLERYQSASDPREAKRAFDALVAASEKSPRAAYACGVLATQPGSVVADRAIALQCLQRAARGGMPEAQHRLGLLLIDGKRDPAQRAEAERWLASAARSLPESVYALELLKAEQGPNPESARRAVVEKAAEAGYPRAQFDLARRLYAQGDDASKAEARGWLAKAAEQDYAEAATELALLIELDRREQDIPRIVALLEKGSKAGSARADYALATRLLEARGVKRDTERAFQLFRRAASQGDTKAIYATGYMLGQGIGTGMDEAAAVEWFRRAADRGDADAMFAIGNSYANGWGVGKSIDVASRWYCRAAQAGSEAGRILISRAKTADCEIGDVQSRTPQQPKTNEGGQSHPR